MSQAEGGVGRRRKQMKLPFAPILSTKRKSNEVSSNDQKKIQRSTCNSVSRPSQTHFPRSVFTGKAAEAKPCPDCTFHGKFLPPGLSNEFLHLLQKDLKWTQPDITLFDKTHPTPRLVAYYGANDYTYSNIHWPATKELPPVLHTILRLVEDRTDLKFNAVLANWYRNGDDYIAAHSDNEKTLLPRSCIATVSLGATRDFVFENKADKSIKHVFELPGGSLLTMQGKTQEEWKHFVPKRKRVAHARISLTFRQMEGPCWE